MIDYENPSQPELNEEVAAARTPKALDKVPKEASEASSEPASLEETLAKIENGDADFDISELNR